ncbi:MAG: hypothetical protein ABIA37_03950, partial [Candidatus Woesearchaeota archaeon]
MNKKVAWYVIGSLTLFSIIVLWYSLVSSQLYLYEGQKGALRSMANDFVEEGSYDLGLTECKQFMSNW